MARADHTGAGGSEQWFAPKPTILADRPVMASTTYPFASHYVLGGPLQSR